MDIVMNSTEIGGLTCALVLFEQLDEVQAWRMRWVIVCSKVGCYG